MDKPNKIKKPTVTAKPSKVMPKTPPNSKKQQTTQQSQLTQPPKKGCGCGNSERANVVRRIINIKRKS